MAIEALCVIMLVLTNTVDHADLSSFKRFLLLLLIATVYAEGGDRIERLRRYLSKASYINASSLWCFAAALVLPVGLAGAFTTLLYVHTMARARRHQSARTIKMIYTATTEVLSTMAASAVIGHFAVERTSLGSSLTLAAAVAMAMFVYAIVNQCLVMGVVILASRPSRLRDVLPSVDDETMEFANLALGVLFAVAIVYAPWLSPFTLVLILVLRRSALVRELQVQATRDAKTGLLNSGGWREEADRELIRAERTGADVSVLMVDLDHFKKLNDSYGHPAGDVALKAVADCLRDALRGYDAVGRFGGEEFIALLTDAGEAVSRVVADRLCGRIRALDLMHGGNITASIGVGMGVAGSNTLDELIVVADEALYSAKRAGRDRVHFSRAKPTVRPAMTSFDHTARDDTAR